MTEKILVTGGAGYIGSHVVSQLGEAGYDIVVYDDCSTGHAQAVLAGQLVVGDLGDKVRLRRTFASHDFTAVLHFAAHTVVPESVADPLKFYNNNTANTLNLLQMCQQFGVKQFVFSSTAAVYGQPQSPLVSESIPTQPINPYGRSKLMSEWMIQDYAAASALRFVILRYFNVAGADPLGRLGQYSKNATHLIKVACDAALGQRSHVQVFGSDFPTPDGTGVRDYIHVTDLAQAHLKALQYLEAGGDSQIFNCGYGRGYSVRQVLETVKAISGRDFPVIETSRRPGDPACVIAQSERIREILGWQPKYDNLTSIVSSAFAWEQKRCERTSIAA